MSNAKHGIDSNHVEIVVGLRKWGASVKSLAEIGNGFPDLVVGYRGLNFLIELKSGRGQLSEVQRKVHSEWKGDMFTVYSLDEAISEIKLRCGELLHDNDFGGPEGSREDDPSQ